MSNPNTRKSCVVPKCTNTTTNAPEKLFFLVPMDVKMRKKWLQAMRRLDPFGDRSTVYCCEDHFDVENDMENYTKYKLVGGRIKLKKGSVPHKFECQQEKNDKPESSGGQKRDRTKYFEKLLKKDQTSTLNAAENICPTHSFWNKKSFPRDPNTKTKWIDETGNKDWFPIKHSTICSIHYKEIDYVSTKKRQLSEKAYPSIQIVKTTNSEDVSGQAGITIRNM